MIPLHATATADPQQLRWVVPATNRPPVGTVRHAPDPLGAWLDRGVIDELVVRGTDVLITLDASHSWRELGDQIRDALGAALADPAGWQVDSSDDRADQLTEITTELLAGQIGALAQSHGGAIELVSVTGDHVAVRMSGSCAGCPAAASTLHDRLQRELRRRAGDTVTVSCENSSAPMSLGKKLLSLLVR
jgi:Fe-S cluster biogenesis protein NfuA